MPAHLRTFLQGLGCNIETLLPSNINPTVRLNFGGTPQNNTLSDGTPDPTTAFVQPTNRDDIVQQLYNYSEDINDKFNIDPAVKSKDIMTS